MICMYTYIHIPYLFCVEPYQLLSGLTKATMDNVDSEVLYALTIVFELLTV
jgi:hypothetical protein